MKIQIQYHDYLESHKDVYVLEFEAPYLIQFYFSGGHMWLSAYIPEHDHIVEHFDLGASPLVYVGDGHVSVQIFERVEYSGKLLPEYSHSVQYSK